MTLMTAAFSTKSIRPQLERLEDRWLPAIQVSQVGPVMTVVGDGGNNLIVVRDNGSNAKGGVAVVTVSGTVKSRGVVTQINVFAGDGRDVVLYNLTGTVQAGVNRHVNVNMGGGVAQACFVSLSGGVSAKALLDITVLGGPDSDRINFTATTADVAAGGFLGVHLFGQGGSDHIKATYTGQVAGGVSILAAGGDFYDSVIVNMTASAGSTGVMRGHVRGGGDPDSLQLLATQSSLTDPLGLDLLMDGGTGNDVGTHTPNVSATGLEGEHIKVA
jgi:hypothetical protein